METARLIMEFLPRDEV